MIDIVSRVVISGVPNGFGAAQGLYLHIGTISHIYRFPMIALSYSVCMGVSRSHVVRTLTPSARYLY